jgi:hypothetical protein
MVSMGTMQSSQQVRNPTEQRNNPSGQLLLTHNPRLT